MLDSHRLDQLMAAIDRARRPLQLPLVVALAFLVGACGTGAETGHPGSAPRATTAPSYSAQSPYAITPPAFSPAPTSRGLTAPGIRATSAVVVDEGSGAVLFDLNGHRRLPPASLTKIATAAVVIQSGDLGRIVEAHPDIDREFLEDSSIMGLGHGDRFSRLDLLYGLLLVSGNDAAEALATDNAGSVAAFVARMNELVGRLQLADTHFTDATGLDSPDHYSSAYDMALLARYAMSLDVFRQVVGTETRTVRGSRDIELSNLNPLLNYTPGVDGVKTGYTEQAGRTFVASAKRDGHRVYVVLFNTTARAEDSIALIEWAFANWSWQADDMG